MSNGHTSIHVVLSIDLQWKKIKNVIFIKFPLFDFQSLV